MHRDLLRFLAESGSVICMTRPESSHLWLLLRDEASPLIPGAPGTYWWRGREGRKEHKEVQP